MRLKKMLKVHLLFCVLVCFTANAQEVHPNFSKVKELAGIEEYLYEPNGMNLLLVQDNSAPVVTVQIVYRVGSKHEVQGNTGSTHLLEHLMFKGTEKFNKKKGTSIDSKLNEIGALMNATTWNDRTNYFETIPSDKIAIALEIEADRMRNSLLLKEDKEAEMTVVRNEFERGENNPNSLLSKEVWATAYMAHTYHHSTIGWRSDIENMPIEVLRDFYNTYYWPDNATLTIIGDFQKENLFELVDEYFGKITKAPHTITQPYTEEPPQYGPRKVIIKKPGQLGLVLIGYKIPGRLHEDLPALRVLGQIMGSGTSSVLTKEFVDKGIAVYGYASPSNFKDVGLFSIGLGIPATSDFEEVNQKLINTLDSIKTAGVQQSDVDRIVSKLNTQSILSRDGSSRIAGQLTEAIAAGDWTDYILGAERLSAVTAEDVKRVANTYLIEDQSTTGYFIPKVPGSNNAAEAAPSGFTPNEEGMYYYRHPDHETLQNGLAPSKANEVNTTASAVNDMIRSSVAKKTYNRKKVSGIDVITAKTGAKEFITVNASFPIGKYFEGEHNEAIPRLTTQLLSKGTTFNDKFAFSQKLESMGVSLSVRPGDQKINISFKCLKKDLPEVIALLAEELRYPLLDAKELAIIKKRITGSIQQGLSDPGTMGGIALSQAVYPEGHPNFSKSIDSTMEDIEKAGLEEIKAFHKTYFGPADMHLVAVGDVDNDALYKAIKKSFKGWTGGIPGKTAYEEPAPTQAMTKVVTIPQKPSAVMLIGQYTGLNIGDQDYIPFLIGNSTLGAGFSGRLMRTVRDESGLTYGIGSSLSGHYNSGGHWAVNATFNPELFQRGLEETMVQLELWVNDGITEEELAAKKTNLTGRYKVGLATTGGLARTILSFVERGKEPSYIEQYPKDIEAVTLEQVNIAIKKYIDLDRLVIIKSGSLDEQGQPLEN